MAARARRQTHTAATPAAPQVAMDTGVASALAAPQAPRLERIAQRAYSLYERRGGQDGSSVEDWLQAEREVDSEA